MKGIFLGPQNPKWVENGLRMIERWINTLVPFRGASAERDGSDGLVPQPMKGEENFVLHGDGKFREVSAGGGGAPGTIPIYDVGGDLVTDADFRYDPTTDTLYAPHITAQSVDADVVFVDPEVYGPGWDGDNSVPTKNDTYDAIQALASQVAAVAPVPIFSKSVQVTPVAGIDIESSIMVGAVTVVATTRLVWVNVTITGSGWKRKKKHAKPSVWTLDMQLKNATTGVRWSLGKITIGIPANSKWTPFSLPLVGAISRLPMAVYNLVLVSSIFGAVPGTVTVNVMGQAP
jgi:hypothetical protein